MSLARACNPAVFVGAKMKNKKPLIYLRKAGTAVVRAFEHTSLSVHIGKENVWDIKRQRDNLKSQHDEFNRSVKTIKQNASITGMWCGGILGFSIGAMFGFVTLL